MNLNICFSVVFPGRYDFLPFPTSYIDPNPHYPSDLQDDLTKHLKSSSSPVYYFVFIYGSFSDRRHWYGLWYEDSHTCVCYVATLCLGFKNPNTLIFSMMLILVFNMACQGKKKHNLKNCLCQFSLWLYLWGIFLITNWCERAKPSVGSTSQGKWAYAT